jgi:Concanavalin A-like lectin/glucanases superfamily
MQAQVVLPAYQGVFGKPIGSIQNNGIVSSGLVLNLDAGNVSSYPGSGSSWFDLSTASNTMSLPADLVNSYSNIGGGSFLFTNTSSKTIVNNAFKNLNSITAISLELWINYSSSGNYQFWISDATCQYRFGITSGGNFFWDMSHHNDFSYSSYVLPTGQWKHVVITSGLESGSIISRIYVNGSLITSQNEGSSTFPSLTQLLIGSGENSTIYLFNGRLSSCRVYNLALTAADVLQNFTSTKGTYGL